MKFQSVFTTAAALAAASFAALPAGAQTPIKGTWTVAACTNVGPSLRGHQCSAGNGQAWSGTPTSFSQVAHIDPFPVGTDTDLGVDATGSATWTSASAGAMSVQNTYQAVFVQEDTSAYLPASFVLEDSWSYTLTATTDELFTLNYDITTGQPGDLGDWDIEVLGGAGVVDQVASGAGTFTYQMSAGGEYFINLQSLGSQTYTEIPVIAAGTVDSDFNWTIVDDASGVPEPSTWALAIAGFGLAGLSLRRQRRFRATAA